VRVKVQAIVVHDERLLVARDRHRGVERLLLPGGRVHDRESITDALVRGVADTTHLDVDPVRLLYVAEIPGLYAAHDLHLVWLAELCDQEVAIPESALIEFGAELPAPLDPPIMDQIAADAEDGWTHAPRWLGSTRRRSERVTYASARRRIGAR
jgi:ADP-ribose pyrophosphatase YjhB (NUDIX family)